MLMLLNLLAYLVRACCIDLRRVMSEMGSTSLLKYFVRKSLKLANAKIESFF